ncbi:MAG: hypothetical protein K1X74_18010, partial [Pirellulales bacterium]|nr:hypothetical protein [Pirellulales bacterium]
MLDEPASALSPVGEARQVRSPDDPALAQLCLELAAAAEALYASGAWPAMQLQRCAAYGVHGWFL